MADATRREFFGWVGGALVVATLPAPVPLPRTARVMPEFTLTCEWGCYTFSAFRRAVEELGDQLDALAARLAPFTEDEVAQVKKNMEAAFDQIRPVGLLVLVEASVDDIRSGQFALVEQSGPGTLSIVRRES